MQIHKPLICEWKQKMNSSESKMSIKMINCIVKLSIATVSTVGEPKEQNGKI